MNQTNRFTGKTAIVTGGAGGIGTAICQRLAGEGAFVIVTDTNAENAHKVAADITAAGGSAVAIPADISSEAACTDLIAQAFALRGQIDVLVNNAGITRDTLLMRMTEEQWDEVINTNLKSAFNLTKAVIKPMLKARSGSIINMSSVVGVKGNAGQANYAASKAGLIGFTKSIAAELGSRNIRCNAIAPGFIETEMTAKLDEKVVQSWREGIPLKRGGSPEDVANACVFMASDLSSYVTGQVLHVDGGMLT